MVKGGLMIVGAIIGFVLGLAYGWVYYYPTAMLILGGLHSFRGCSAAKSDTAVMGRSEFTTPRGVCDLHVMQESSELHIRESPSDLTQCPHGPT